MSQVSHRGLALVLSLLLAAPQALTLVAEATPQTATITVNCADAMPAMDALRAALDDDAAAADLLAKLKDAMRQGRTIGPEELDPLVEDVMAGLESATDQAEQAVIRTGNRIEALKLNRRAGRTWPEHTRSVRNAANQLRSDMRRVPRSGKPMRFVNGRAVSKSRGFGVDPQARASLAGRPSAATEPFNQMFRSANGFWTAVKDTVDAAQQEGLASALGQEEPFLNLSAQASRLGENVEMLGMARGLAGVGSMPVADDPVGQHLTNARDAFDKLEGAVRGACAQQTTQSREQPQQSSDPQVGSEQSNSAGGANWGLLGGVLGGAIGGGLLLGDALKPKEADSKQCGAKPAFTSTPPSSSQIAAYRSWCQCLGYRTSGTASNGDYTCLN